MSILWVAAAAFGFFAGLCLVVGLVAPGPLSPAAVVACLLCCLGAAWSSAGLAALYGSYAPAIASVFFSAATCFIGYRIAASLLLDVLTVPSASSVQGTLASDKLAVILADAEPHRYDPHVPAARLKRIERTDAATLSTGVLPLVFLAERVRYRALRGPHPARYIVEAVTDAVRSRLHEPLADLAVEVAYVDSSPNLASLVARARPSSVVLIELGASGSLPFLEARLEAERAAASYLTCPPSVWRDERMALRLRDRILDRVPEDTRASTGVALFGSGIPDAWHAQSASWLEDETYFLTRATVLLEEAGLPAQAIRHAWLDWQEPSLAEAIRHLAATGSDRIVVCPATILYPDLSTMLDVSRDVRDARLPEHVQVTVLPPWGDDEVLVEILASRIADAFGLETTVA
ncbi:MAG: CbiX/SirB N-terminal domain-containing protein [Anaerosomatales bacterium]|nr:hypothetical protein [Coriobacteriia bacterium]MDI6692758.1 CbiX/SirB N-terminal domain-containing protein [Anaerosomatales bacterium]MDI6843902.1 CbiX/SirB N-terminal domain-containing protein [Anaerosomatales bacterium]